MRNSVWDRDPEAYDARRRWDSWLEQRRLTFWRDWIVKKSREQGLSEPQILEIGSGTGFLAAKTVESCCSEDISARWTGVEPLDEYVRISQQRIEGKHSFHNLSFYQGEAEDLVRAGVAGRNYDFVLSNDVLHHVQSLPRVLEQLADVTRAGSVWGVMEPNAFHPYIFLCQALRRGEKNFFQKYFLDQATRFGWVCESNRFLFAIPSFMSHPPIWMKNLEKRIENKANCGGAIFLEMRRK